MGIVGLTTRNDVGFPRLGKIRKGGEQRDGVNKKGQPIKIVGPDLDHFRFTCEVPGLEQTLIELYGPEPRELKVWLPYATIEQNFDPWMKEYGVSGLKRMCDGAQQHVWLPDGASTYVSVAAGAQPLPCIRASGGKCECMRDAGLKVMLGEVFAMGRTGYFELKTSSTHDILHIQAVLNQAFMFRSSLLGIPFVLRRVPSQKSFPMEGKRGKKVYDLIQMEIDPDWMRVQFENQYAIAMGREPKTIAPSMPTYAEVEARVASKALPPVEASPIDHNWKERIKNARDPLGFTREQAIAIAQDNDITLRDGITISQVDAVIAAMEAEAVIEYEVTIEGEVE